MNSTASRLVIAAALAPLAAGAENLDLVPLKTSSGCEVQFFAEVVNMKGAAVGDKVSWEWNGACIGGLAQGFGTLTRRHVTEHANMRFSWSHPFHAGRPFSYGKSGFSIDYLNSPTLAPVRNESWALVADGAAVAFTDGWGFTLDDASLKTFPMQAPRRVAMALRSQQRLNTGTRALMLMESPCLIHKDLPGCANDDERKVYQFSEFAVGGDAAANYKNRKVTYCPDPHSLQGCEATAERLSAPVRDQIFAFIDQARPAADASAERMNAVLQAQARSAPAAPAPATAGTPAAAPAAANRDLDALPVGALYALADEYNAKNDRVQARAALRALVRRFPDHPLAAVAVKQLAALQAN